MNSMSGNHKDPMSWEEPSRNRKIDVDQRIELERSIQESRLTNVERMKSFPRFVQTSYIRKFVSRLKIYELVLENHGSIVECGVLGGDGLFSWAHFVEIFEPYNHLRRIVGFDTFRGFPDGSLQAQDSALNNSQLKAGGLERDVFIELTDSVRIFDMNRPLSHLTRLQLIKGNAVVTIPEFLKQNPEFLVSLLWLDFDVYEPTKTAIRNFLPRMHSGSIIAFDELSHPLWPGETIAALEELELPMYEVKRFPFGSTVSYIRLG